MISEEAAIINFMTRTANINKNANVTIRDNSYTGDCVIFEGVLGVLVLGVLVFGIFEIEIFETFDIF